MSSLERAATAILKAEEARQLAGKIAESNAGYADQVGWGADVFRRAAAAEAALERAQVELAQLLVLYRSEVPA